MSQSIRDGRDRRPRWVDLLALAALSIPSVLIALRSLEVGVGCAALQGPLDARFVGYILEWGFLHLQGSIAPEASLWSPPFFFPVPNILAYSENLIAGYPTYFLLRWSGFQPAVALFLFHLLHRALTPLISYLCLRAFRLGRWPALIGAAIFSWGWVRFFHYGHIQFAAGYPIPLFFTALYFAFHRRRPWALVLASWTFLFTWYFSLYTAIFLALGTVFLAVVGLLLPGGRPEIIRSGRYYLRNGKTHPRQALAIVLCCLIAGALLVPSALAYLDVHQQFGAASETEVRIYWGNFASWFRPPPQHTLLGDIYSLFPAESGAKWEKKAFLGWLGLAGLLLPLIGLLIRGKGIYLLWPRSLVKVSGAGAAIILIFSSYGGTWAEAPFWFLHDHFPGLSGLRAPTRVAFIVSWFVTICVAAHLDHLLRRGSGARWLALGFGLILLAENIAPLPRIADRCKDERIWKRTERHLCPQIPKNEVGTLLFLPANIHSVDRIVQNSLAMQLSLTCDLNVVNGYSGRRPKLIAPLLGSSHREFPCQAVRKILDQAHQATGKGVLLFVDRKPPLGPPGYPTSTIETCLDSCLEPPPEWYVGQPARPADVLVTDPASACGGS